MGGGDKRLKQYLFSSGIHDITEDEMAGWHHRLNGHECEQMTRHGEGQGSLACCSPQDREELSTTEQLNGNNTQDRKVLHGPLSNSWGGERVQEADTLLTRRVPDQGSKSCLWL